MIHFGTSLRWAMCLYKKNIVIDIIVVVFIAIKYSLTLNSYPRSRSQTAVNMAKSYIEQYFIVVGITEDMHGFFELLEYRLPHLFSGIAEFYEKCK